VSRSWYFGARRRTASKDVHLGQFVRNSRSGAIYGGRTVGRVPSNCAPASSVRLGVLMLEAMVDEIGRLLPTAFVEQEAWAPGFGSMSDSPVLLCRPVWSVEGKPVSIRDA
jgi:hypothetical protein